MNIMNAVIKQGGAPQEVQTNIQQPAPFIDRAKTSVLATKQKMGEAMKQAEQQ